MRLLSTGTLKLREFYRDKVPNYAILSHRWGEEEVTFQDVENQTFAGLKGYRKLLDCCKRAAEDGYDWVWIDTCCIDKTSSAELSEAINSMYSWYSNSSVCYAYLEDLESSSILAVMKSIKQFKVLGSINDLGNLNSIVDSEELKLISYLEEVISVYNLKKSKWFSRGWTLQELIAPSRVIFFNGRWKTIGSRKSLARHISPITGIPLDILYGRSPLFSTVAQRMSWASKRQTTREEDIAYCLMGIFDIHMPPIYGEGYEKAFLRLQEEILRQNSDQTLFIWGTKHEPYNHGLLATSPAAFCDEPRCFSGLFLEGMIVENPDSPYSSLRPISHRPTAKSFDKNGVPENSWAADSTATQVSLGSNGLQISLLQEDKLLRKLLPKLLICLDVVVVCQGTDNPVVLLLDEDINYNSARGFIPNRLGSMRRHISPIHPNVYYLPEFGYSFTRTNTTISQFRTSACGPGQPAIFRLEDSKTISSIGGITTIEMGGRSRSLIRLAEPFKCSGAVMLLEHDCQYCNEMGGYEIMFGTRPNSHPWCSFVKRRGDFDLDTEVRYSQVEKLSARYYEQDIAGLKCNKKGFLQILPEEDGRSYIIRIYIA